MKHSEQSDFAKQGLTVMTYKKHSFKKIINLLNTYKKNLMNPAAIWCQGRL